MISAFHLFKLPSKISNHTIIMNCQRNQNHRVWSISLCKQMFFLSVIANWILISKPFTRSGRKGISKYTKIFSKSLYHVKFKYQPFLWVQRDMSIPSVPFLTAMEGSMHVVFCTQKLNNWQPSNKPFTKYSVQKVSARNSLTDFVR